MFLSCSYFPDCTLQCHKEECQTEYNKNTPFHFFHSFSFKQRTQAATGRCSTKNRFCNCAKTYQKIPPNEFNFSLSCRLQVWSFTKVELFHRYFSQILNTDAAVQFADQLLRRTHIQIFLQNVFNGCFSIALINTILLIGRIQGFKEL